jgi:hypothetical protein
MEFITPSAPANTTTQFPPKARYTGPPCEHCSAQGFPWAKGHSFTDCRKKVQAHAAQAAGVVTDSSNKQSSHYFIIDSGANANMTPHSEVLFDYIPFIESKPVTLGNGSTVNAVGYGNIYLTSEVSYKFTPVP